MDHYNKIVRDQNVHCACNNNMNTIKSHSQQLSHVCLNAEKLLAIAGRRSLTFFRVPLKNSLYISERRYRV